MAAKRPTLAQRNRDAIANLATTSTPSTNSAASTDSPSSALNAASAPSANTGRQPATITVHLTQNAYQDAQSAAIADWEQGGPDSFAAWIIQALRHYATKPPHTRLPDPTTVAGGSPRSFRVDSQTRDIVDEALVIDARHGHITSRSVWAATAIRDAVNQARQRGPLPHPPDRMPPRFPRRPDHDAPSGAAN